MAALVAEELDVAWKDVRVIHGPAAQAYYNGGLATGHAEFEDGKHTAFQEFTRRALEVAPKTLSLQITGGSSATIDAYEKMRMAGATAREVLKMAATSQFGENDYRTEDGHVISKDGIKHRYIDLAEATYPEIRGTIVPAELFDEVVRLRDEYRRKAQSPNADSL